MDRRLAVVTSGGTGIGRAVAAALARRGDEVVILGRRAEVLERTAAELGVRWRQADVTRRQDVQAAYNGRGGVYTVAKAGMVGLTYWLALDLGPEGITVNAVAPGFIEDTEFFGGGLTPEGRQRRVDLIPAGRPGSPEEIAAAVAYLASPEAAYVNGEVHHVNGAGCSAAEVRPGRVSGPRRSPGGRARAAPAPGSRPGLAGRSRR
jgi:NAD(P)-dependent dehydrogenase (short-subunit alcohol dehydrogenase family)